MRLGLACCWSGGGHGCACAKLCGDIPGMSSGGRQAGGVGEEQRAAGVKAVIQMRVFFFLLLVLHKP